MLECQISALADGELDNEETITTLAFVREQPELQQKWNMYHEFVIEYPEENMIYIILRLKLVFQKIWQHVYQN